MQSTKKNAKNCRHGRLNAEGRKITIMRSRGGRKGSNTLVPGIRRSTRRHKGAAQEVSSANRVLGDMRASVFDGAFKNVLAGKKCSGKAARSRWRCI